VSFSIAGITACHSAARPDDFVPFVDASTIDASCVSNDMFEPITATGFSPAGPLDVYHYTHTYWSCGMYVVELLPTTMARGCSPDRALVWSFGFSRETIQPAMGTFSATAEDTPGWSTIEASFEATSVDPPTAASPQLIGRFVANAPGWSIDLSIDVHAQDLGLGGCTL
jgi:hypothetical protein